MIKKTTLGPILFASCLGSSQAAVLFADNFDRANSGAAYDDNTTYGPIDNSLDGITDGTGASLTANNVYTLPTSVGGSGILDNQLLLASGGGTSNAYISHNFTNSSITTAGGFSVSLDINGYTQTGLSRGGAFAVGLSQADANAAGDAQGNNAYTSAFSTNTAVGNFWYALRGDNTVAWGIGSTDTGSATVGDKIGTIRAEFLFSDFNAGSNVAYSLFYDDVPVTGGTGIFTWNASDTNFIGLDSRDGDGVLFDNLSIETIPEPGAALLGGLSLLCLLRRKR